MWTCHRLHLLSGPVGRSWSGSPLLSCLTWQWHFLSMGTYTCFFIKDLSTVSELAGEFMDIGRYENCCVAHYYYHSCTLQWPSWYALPLHVVSDMWFVCAQHQGFVWAVWMQPHNLVALQSYIMCKYISKMQGDHSWFAHVWNQWLYAGFVAICLDQQPGPGRWVAYPEGPCLKSVGSSAVRKLKSSSSRDQSVHVRPGPKPQQFGQRCITSELRTTTWSISTRDRFIFCHQKDLRRTSEHKWKPCYDRLVIMTVKVTVILKQQVL